MKYIDLTQGKRAIVDDEDFHYLTRFEWFFMDTPSGKFCATSIRNKTIYMHEMILPADTGYYLKHKNGDNLDNRKENFAMISINHRRHLGMKKRMGASIYRGVQKDSKQGWKVMIAKDKKKYFLGRFADEKKAARVYNKKAKELYGAYAYQNKIDD